MCLKGSCQIIAFKIQAMPLNDTIKTADTICSIDPVSDDMTQNALSCPRRDRQQSQCLLHHLRQNTYRKVEAKSYILNREISKTYSRQIKQLFLKAFNVF